MGTAKVGARVPLKVKASVSALAERRQIGEGEMWTEIAESYLNGSDHDRRVMITELARLKEEVEVISQNQALLIELLRMFMESYFARAGSIPPDQKEAAAYKATTTMEKILKSIERKLGGGDV